MPLFPFVKIVTKVKTIKISKETYAKLAEVVGNFK
jgi:hypothetical protein